MSQPSRPDEDLAFEERPLVQEAIENDTTAPGFERRAGGRAEPDPDTPAFQEPGQPPMRPTG
jgi:hypothetical protein